MRLVTAAQDMHAHAARLLAVSVGSVGVAWVADAEIVLRILASVVAICSGVAGLVYYGRLNKWWK